MFNSELINIWFELNQLEIRHWQDVNHNNGKDVHHLYTIDGIFAVGPQVRNGQNEIKSFYENRAKRGIRTTRHLISNFQVEANSEANLYKSRAIISLYAGDDIPILKSNPAILLGDVESLCILDNKKWKFKSHVITPIFVGEDTFVNEALNTKK